MSRREDDTRPPARYGDAIEELLAAASRTRDPEARVTLTTLAEMFARLHQSNISAASDSTELDDMDPPAPTARQPF